MSPSPLQGTWRIHVKRSGKFIIKTFEVAEFTLPRFEVTLTGPKHIVSGAKTVSVKVCAR